MSKTKLRDPDASAEYDFSRGKRGVHYERASKGMRVVIVTDEEDRARKDVSKRRPKDD